MNSVFLGFAAALLYSFSQVFTRRALDENEPLTVVLGTLATTFVTVTALMILSGRNWLWPAPSGLVVLVAAGLVAPGAARLLGAIGLRDFGPLVAVPFQFGTRPVVALAAGLVFFNERVGGWRLLALLAIVAGLFWLTTGFNADADDPPASSRLWIPAMAGLAYALSEILRKAGVSFTDSVTAAWIAGASALALVGGVSLSLPAIRTRVHVPRDWHWILSSGGAAAIAQVVMFTALANGDITVVSPVMALQPMIVMLIAPSLAAAGNISLRSVWKGGLLMTMGAVIIGLSA
ncbi:MAG: DMT family transporter [Acidimicrobiia bacterium]|nr:DMT family transporter [Acidimicrobiia bacterium]